MVKQQNDRASKKDRRPKRVRFTQEAMQDIQGLRRNQQDRVNFEAQRLVDNQASRTSQLRGNEWDKVNATRVGQKIRLLWQWHRGDKVITRVMPRELDYDAQVALSIQRQSECLEDCIVEESDEISEEELAEKATYAMPEDENWSDFVYQTYRLHPVLTASQEDLYKTIIAGIDTSAWLVQSAPGTGKTVCALNYSARLYEEHQYRVQVILPENLLSDVEAFPRIQQQVTTAENKGSFWCGTYWDWLRLHLKDCQIASPEQELDAFQRAALRVPGDKRKKLQSLTSRDVILYQAYVLGLLPTKDAGAVFDQNRIETLRNIESQWWRQELRGTLCRHQAALQLCNAINQGSFVAPVDPAVAVFVDEAQDLLLVELEALIAFHKWHLTQRKHSALVLLGDLNQRISPTGFTWEPLQKDTSLLRLERNHRNSRQILEFANCFWEMARECIAVVDGRWPPPPSDPTQALSQEAIRVLRFENAAQADRFLIDITSSQGSGRYLRQVLAQSVKVLWPNPVPLPETLNALILDAQHAKSREFASCVAFRMFEGRGQLTREECNKWYTLLTRTRSRLLIVITEDEIDRLGGESILAKCEKTSSEQARFWISELASDVDTADVSNLSERLLEACRYGTPYWDTYDLAQEAGLDLNDWEQQALTLLRVIDKKHLAEELVALKKEIDMNIRSVEALECLLLRAMGRSHDAVKVAEALRDAHPKEYQRLGLAIAEDLTALGLAFEAKRIRSKFGVPQPTIPDWIKQEMPLPQAICEHLRLQLSQL